MISQETWMILTPLQKLPKNEGDLSKVIVAKSFQKVAQSAKNRQIWSHCLCATVAEQGYWECGTQAVSFSKYDPILFLLIFSIFTSQMKYKLKEA